MRDKKKHGRPHPTKGKGRGYLWLCEHKDHDGDECLIWPFGAPNGYGMLGHHGKIVYAHRVMCEIVHGPCPSPDHEAAHSCGNGANRCVHPKHLGWKTRSENQLDRAAHGTKNHGWKGKLTQKQADEIKALKGRMTQAAIAKRYGVSRSNISFIHTGKAWSDPDSKYARYRRHLGI